MLIELYNSVLRGLKVLLRGSSLCRFCDCQKILWSDGADIESGFKRSAWIRVSEPKTACDVLIVLLI
jgi:hypothetical protein